MHRSRSVEVVGDLEPDTMLRTHTAGIRRYAVAAVCSLFALTIPAAAGAEPLRTDLDGDGLHDRIELGRHPGLLAVRLSGTRHWLHLSTNDLIVRFVVADIDRDGDPDVVAETQHSGLHFWINKGHGRFASRSLKVGHRAIRAHHVKPAVRSVQELRVADSALNDPNRLLAVLPSPFVDWMVAAGPIALAASAPLSKFTHRRRAARGPPSLLFS